jgi:tRNA(Ile2) C34 agmatinyltransferase TiaS
VSEDKEEDGTAAAPQALEFLERIEDIVASLEDLATKEELDRQATICRNMREEISDIHGRVNILDKAMGSLAVRFPDIVQKNCKNCGGSIPSTGRGNCIKCGKPISES